MLKKYLFLQESKAGLLGQAINGFLHFATFRFDLHIKICSTRSFSKSDHLSWKPAGENEKSLAKVDFPLQKLSRHAKGSPNHPTQSKILMSINSVVMSVAASYRTLKRGAVTFRHTIFIYLSLLCQVVLQKQQKRQRQWKRQRQRLSAILKTPIL